MSASSGRTDWRNSIAAAAGVKGREVVCADPPASEEANTESA
eukprot:CAMPEP_0180176092 /NCGR_PEP_ID=MMETSP0986-20121125/37091_1 /TAXON_ID=697907 /ORGANISM="non described non described, Strain CCMP2293" /LENGTH=41 /DNA_ID= /DNA_START= /DNA_END= /DNA_ORIENTATION=